MSYAYYNCGNLTGLAECGPNVINMYKAYTNCVNLTNAIIGPKVSSIYQTYANCSSLQDLTILSPYIEYNDTLLNVNPDLKIYIPDKNNLLKYMESEWENHGKFMYEGKNLYLKLPQKNYILLNSTMTETL
jgi:hypothetical protein